MFAAVPAILQEIAAWIGVLTVVVGGSAALFTRKPFRWVWDRLVAVPFSEWVKQTITESETGRLVAYHLGPNGTTPPLHERVQNVEHATGVEEEP